MRILVDLTYIQPERMYKSLSIYAFRFLNSLTLNERKSFILLVLNNMEETLKKKLPGFEIKCYDPYTSTMSGNRFIRFYKRMRIFQKAVDNLNCNCLFVPNDLVSFSCVKTKTRKVVVVHDMKSLKGAHTWKEKSFQLLTKIIYKRLLNTSDQIIAISNYTKRDILDILGEKYTDKIKVVYNSVTIPAKSITPNFYVPSKYVLYVNSLLPYKNIKTMLKAFSHFYREKSEFKLVIVGAAGDYWQNKMMPLIREMNLDDKIIQLQNIEDGELKYLYEHASLFVTPSLHEGFGYTPIEAAICKCPVVSSKCEALPDTTMNLLNYYEPAEDSETLSKVMLSVVDKDPCQKELEDISRKFIERYNPQIYKNKILDILTESKK
jgi:glycosyltransferase involved in cell wall biosynthesis